MCYYGWNIEELVRVSEWDDGKYSYADDECHQSIEDDSIKMSFSISSKNAVDNKTWFSNEDAERLAISSAKILTEKYPDKIILVVAGVQTCNGGYEPPDRVIAFHNRKELFDTSCGWNVDSETPSAHLSDDILDIIRIRQSEVEEEERLEKIKWDNYWNKRKALFEPMKEAYEKVKSGSNMKTYGYGPTGLSNFSLHDDENSHVNQAYRAGIKQGFEKAFEYIQKNPNLLQLINDNVIMPEEKV